ncbi:Ig-like domain-containing protein [Glaciecola petra]|uniref:Ig-like domain-containing protein n=1 Tax=Glaciecola petra TaxID=3075602 RepID=A0ABU2ZQC5_9ALTE|nr:Ig-like domain-containing protein [Aestuariibacter sp. P117]MDT0593662.1 Ig-like domain-containing protein [Aestuariibacter sp. P117]
MRSHSIATALLIATFSLLLLSPNCFGKGPGIGNLDYSENQLFQPISLLESPKGHGTVALVDGYLMTIYSSDGGGRSSDGGFDFWDISDPYNPVLFSRFDNVDTNGIREAHGFGLSNSYPVNYAVVQAVDGIQFWDVSEVENLKLVNYLDLPGIVRGDYSGDWWIFWQAPYVYVGGVEQGLYIVDATDPQTPILVKNISTKDLGGLNPSQVFVVGNLMLIAEAREGEFASLDVSDPENPVLLNRFSGKNGYSHLFAAGTLFTSGGNGNVPKVYVTNVNHNGEFDYIGEIGPDILSNGGYGTYQDGFFHSGFSNGYSKFKIFNENGEYDLAYVGTGSSELDGADEDFGIVLGNLAFVGNDHGASALIVHQQEPDTSGPEVHWVHPADGTTQQARSSRIGISMSDLVDIESVNASTFSVQSSSDKVLQGKYSVQQGIVNFSPNSILEPNTTYEITVEGIKDVMGNPSPVFTSTFETGNYLAPTCSIAELQPVKTRGVASYSIEFISEQDVESIIWEFGDNSQAIEAEISNTITHSFDLPGRYNVTATVSNINGTSKCSKSQIVYNSPLDQPPVASKTLAVNSNYVFVANPDNHSVTAINKDTHQLAWETRVGENPTSLTLSPNGNLWVVNEKDASIAVVSTNSGEVIKTIQLALGTSPYGIVNHNDNFYVTLADTGQLIKVNTDGEIVSTLNIGGKPQSIAVETTNNRIFIADLISASRNLDAPSQLPVGEVIEVDADTMQINQVHRLAYDITPDTELTGRGVPNYLNAVAISPDGSYVLIPSKKDNVTRGQFYDGTNLTFESRVRASLNGLNIVTNTEVMEYKVDLNDRNMPRDVIYSPLGDLLFIAMQGNDLVEIRDAFNPSKVISNLNVGAAPRSLLIDSHSNNLYVHNYLSRSVTIYNITNLLNASGNNAVLINEVFTVSSETLSTNVLNGKRLFYNASDPRLSRDGYISCASCHQDGGNDGQNWDLTQSGEGLRNTIDLNGKAGTLLGNVHWTSNFDEIQDFENDIRNLNDGTGLLTDAEYQNTIDPLGTSKAGLSPDLDDLADYVSSLNEFSISPHRLRDGSLTEKGTLGKQLFEDLNCHTCHSGQSFSDGKRHDVGTVSASSGKGVNSELQGVGFKTPTLKNLWKTAPYFHNGQAQSLIDTLAVENHVGEVSEDDKLNLVAYLLQIDKNESAPAIPTPAPLPDQVTKSAGSMNYMNLIFLLLVVLYRDKQNTRL